MKQREGECDSCCVEQDKEKVQQVQLNGWTKAKLQICNSYTCEFQVAKYPVKATGNMRIKTLSGERQPEVNIVVISWYEEASELILEE